MEQSQQFSTEIIIQYSIVGLILLSACGWILWKVFRRNKKEYARGCCGCAIADSCKKINTKDKKSPKKSPRSLK